MSTRFDEAVTAVITGDAATLKKLLQEDPGLIEARAPSEHRSTLLHYVGANGSRTSCRRRRRTPWK